MIQLIEVLKPINYALSLISQSTKLNGLIDTVILTAEESLAKHLPKVVPFSAFIVHAKDHWITVSNAKPDSEKSDSSNEWIVYDSLNNEKYLKYLKPFFAILKKLDPSFNGKYRSVQVIGQNGSDDSGLFAIAYVLAIANKKDPAKLKFNQSKMRSHFNSCVKNQQFVEFESKAKDLEPVYCNRRFNL
jgi:hypothetical protein